ncbi:hypothetical protein [Prosthecobacter sp.]|uniref:hypothetical protein n=1 Tax=Prosthecobacter sp. TaxID=1965333 RepID=UPI0037852C03
MSTDLFELKILLLRLTPLTLLKITAHAPKHQTKKGHFEGGRSYLEEGANELIDLSKRAKNQAEIRKYRFHDFACLVQKHSTP